MFVLAILRSLGYPPVVAWVLFKEGTFLAEILGCGTANLTRAHLFATFGGHLQGAQRQHPRYRHNIGQQNGSGQDHPDYHLPIHV